jgi:hypothetical protein
MQCSHTAGVATVAGFEFDDPNLLSHAGILPLMTLARRAGLASLAEERLTVPADKGSHPGVKVMAMVAGMAMGADLIDDLDAVRSGAMRQAVGFGYAPSTLGQFLRKFTFGHVRQLDAVASRFLCGLVGRSGLLGPPDGKGTVFVDADDSVVEAYGHAKQGTGRGYSGVNGLNMLVDTVSGPGFAPVILGTRMRRGLVSSVRGAAKAVRDSLALVGRTSLAGRDVVFRADSAYWASEVVRAALKGGAQVTVTARLFQDVARAIASVPQDAWEGIRYPHAVWDDEDGRWVSDAEVAEVPFTAFAAQRKANRVEGRLVVRRVKRLNPQAAKGQDELFASYRHHPVFTTLDGASCTTAEVDAPHRDHAVVEQVHADLKASAMAHVPSGVFTANAAWLVFAAMAFNLTRAAATLTGEASLARAETATVRRRLVAVPARTARSGRRLRLHLPEGWAWEAAWGRWFDRATGRVLGPVWAT